MEDFPGGAVDKNLPWSACQCRGHKVLSLVWEDFTCRKATKSTCHTSWSLHAYSLCSTTREARAHRNQRKSVQAVKSQHSEKYTRKDKEEHTISGSGCIGKLVRYKWKSAGKLLEKLSYQKFIVRDAFIVIFPFSLFLLRCRYDTWGYSSHCVTMEQ